MHGKQLKQGKCYFDTIVLYYIELVKHFDHARVDSFHRFANSACGAFATKSAHSTSGLVKWSVIQPDFINQVPDSDSFQVMQLLYFQTNCQLKILSLVFFFFR